MMVAENVGPGTRALLFMAVAVFVMVLGDSLISLSSEEDKAAIATMAFFSIYGMMLLVVWVFVSWERRGPISELGLQSDSNTIPQLVVGGLSGFAAAGLVYLIAFIFAADLRPIGASTGELLVSEIIMTVPVALVEELYYRGYLMTRMAEAWGRRTGILASSAFFSILHYSWWMPLGTVPLELIVMFTVNIFLGGVVLGLSYYLSGERLWVPIAFHFVWNIMAYVLFPVFPTQPVASPLIWQIEWGITTVLGFLFGLCMIWSLIGKYRAREQR